MKNIYYILVLFFIFTNYLLSQNGVNEQIIKVDTVIRIDTVVIIKIDTVEKDNEKKGVYIISAKGGIGLLQVSASANFDIPLNKLNLTSKYIVITTGDPGGGGGKATTFLGLGLGFITKKTDHYISKLNLYIGRGRFHTSGRFAFGIGVGWDMLFGSNHLYFSVSPECVIAQSNDYYNSGMGFIGISLGLNGIF